MSTTECRKCHRTIGDAAKHDGLGPKCWRARLTALGIQPAKTFGHGRRNWAKDMPGQEELQLEEAD